MKAKKLILGALGYTVCTFVLAVVWHVLLFEETYRSFGYFEGGAEFPARPASRSCSRASSSQRSFR